MQVKMISVNDIAVVYTVGDEMSFTEFIMALRRILADRHHPSCEDIMDKHEFMNLSSTRVHPLLAKMRARQPSSWFHVKAARSGGGPADVDDPIKVYSTGWKKNFGTCR